MADQATASGTNPDYDPWHGALDAIADHLQEDDSACEGRQDAEEQAGRILDALRRRGLSIGCPTYEANKAAENG